MTGGAEPGASSAAGTRPPAAGSATGTVPAAVVEAAGADRVDLWVIRTDQPAPVVRRLRDLLDRTELDRAGAGRDQVRTDRFTVVHGVVRLLTAERLGAAPAELAWRRGPHGKPEPVTDDGATGPRLQISYSASGALAVLALAEGRRVGADVEEIRDERVAARVAGRYFPDGDVRFVAAARSPGARAERFARLWCRREACVKVYGGRLAQGLGLPLAGPAPLRLPDAGALDPGPCWIRDVPVPGPFRAAVAVEGDRPFEVRRRRWTPDADRR
ncbi:4'-phosphopantetheinyl transferase family protein [Kitasatospora sp. NPDC057015]|uniref:4'-phosphopantetheinyl transferase family protein n=1 Tax=Kitasatospora sp. NPDC057015 TaxID=3346001 RepID=UPI003635113D